LVNKADNWQVLAEPGNVISMEADHGDLWELYRPLDGASTVAMTEKHGAPKKGEALFSTDTPPDLAAITTKLKRGPVLSEFYMQRPFSNQGRLCTTIRLYAGLKRIELQTRILNNDRFVRYRVIFPTNIKLGLRTDEIPFGALHRPEGIELPAQNWVDTSDQIHGVAMLNRGLPGNNINDGTLMLSLMRSTCIVAYGFGGGYEPGMSSDSGFELGKELVFDYALVPHSGNWQSTHIYQEGQEFNQPLLIQKTLEHAGDWPNQWGSLSISHPNILVSALKQGESGGWILRLYEAAGTVTPGVTILFSAQVRSVELVNLVEDLLKPLDLEGNQVSLEFHPFEIKTLRLN
jgi:alpha-mannosidase